jgi:subtilisin family serine protease
VLALRPSTQIELARAILLAVQWGAHVINISGGQVTLSGHAHPLLLDAVRWCNRERRLIVAASGNDGSNAHQVPACLRERSVLPVGAMDQHMAPLPGTNWGDAYAMRGVLGLGELTVAYGETGSIIKSGSSYAAAFTTGIVALLLSEQVICGRKPDPLDVRDALVQSAWDGRSSIDHSEASFLEGRINGAAAARMLGLHGPRIP